MNYQRRLENAVRKKWSTPELKEWWWTKFGAARRARTRRLSEAQGHRCAFCSNPTYMGEDDYQETMNRKRDLATLEHVVPQKDGGTDNPSNCVMSCFSCNSYRGTMDAWEFYEIRNDPVKWLAWFTSLKKSKDLRDRLRKEKEDEEKPTKVATVAFRYAYWTLVSPEYSALFDELTSRVSEAYTNYLNSNGPRKSAERFELIQAAQEAASVL